MTQERAAEACDVGDRCNYQEMKNSHVWGAAQG